MRFICLGTGSGMPDADLNPSSLYVETGRKRLLFDCGEGCARQLLRHGLDASALDAVFISHYHPDHVSGLFMLLQMMYLQKRTKALELFLPERPAEMLEAIELMYTFPQRFSFPLTVLDCQAAELYHEDISAAVNDHLNNYRSFLKERDLPHQMKSYSFRVSSPAGDLVYTSDLHTTDSIGGLLRDCHTAIVDGLHPEPAQILKLEYAGIQRVLLTHGSSPALDCALEQAPEGLIGYARQDDEYWIGHEN